MMRKSILIVLVIFGVSAAVLHQAIQSPRFWEFAVAKTVSWKTKDIKFLEIHIQDVKLLGLDAVTFTGIATKFEFRKNVYSLSVGSIEVEHLRSIKGERIYADLYGGSVDGKVIVDLQSRRYTADILLHNIDTVQLAKNAAFFGNVKGVVLGNIHIAGEGEDIKDLKADLHMLPQGAVKAELLRYLAQYLPQRQELETLIKNNEDIPLDTASIVITSSSNSKFLYNIVFNSSKLNLNMNVDLDMTMDRSIQDLLGQIGGL